MGEVYLTNIPRKLNRSIEAGPDNKQFHGSVSQVQVFKEGNMTDISTLP